LADPYTIYISYIKNREGERDRTQKRIPTTQNLKFKIAYLSSPGIGDFHFCKILSVAMSEKLTISLRIDTARLIIGKSLS
jgi:hypothetical protein